MSTPQKPKIIFIEGDITAQSFKEACAEHKLPEEKTVFVFPVNLTVVNPDYRLRTWVSWEIQRIKQGHPLRGSHKYTLGLPIAWDGDVPQKIHQYHHIHNADELKRFDGLQEKDPSLEMYLPELTIGNLWEAIGQGYSIAIPVRRHHNNQYFNKCLDENCSEEKCTNDNHFEPDFWGEEGCLPADNCNNQSNARLGDWYVSEIKKINTFLKTSDMSQIDDSYMAHRYEVGQNHIPPSESLEKIGHKNRDHFLDLFFSGRWRCPSLSSGEKAMALFIGALLFGGGAGILDGLGTTFASNPVGFMAMIVLALASAVCVFFAAEKILDEPLRPSNVRVR